MTKFNLFDRIKLTESVPLTGFMCNACEALDIASVGTDGVIVEVLEPGEAFLVEFFGDWVVLEDSGGFQPASAEDSGAFRKTLGVDTVYTHQMELVGSSTIDKLSLFQLLDSLPEDLLEEVKTFAESLSNRG